MTDEAPGARRFSAIVFDCDGVLADSEPLVDRVISADLTARGWPLTPHEAGSVFFGIAIPSMVPIIEAHLGSLPETWAQEIKYRIADTMAREVEPVPGAPEALAAVSAAGMPMALASNSSRLELKAKLDRLGFTAAFAGRIFSFEDVPRPKPNPDLYLAAAAACGADPAGCVVIEDSATGVRAGVAAGCTVFGLSRVTDPKALSTAGASLIFPDLAQLPGLLGLSVDAT